MTLQDLLDSGEATIYPGHSFKPGQPDAFVVPEDGYQPKCFRLEDYVVDKGEESSHTGLKYYYMLKRREA